MSKRGDISIFDMDDASPPPPPTKWTTYVHVEYIVVN
jgi:hypothetical protein